MPQPTLKKPISTKPWGQMYPQVDGANPFAGLGQQVMNPAIQAMQNQQEGDDAMTGALAQPAGHATPQFDLNVAMKDLLATGGGKHVAFNPDGSMDSPNNPHGVDWVKAHTASPDELAQRVARMGAETRPNPIPIHNPADNMAAFNALAHPQHQDVFAKDNVAGGTMRLTIGPNGQPSGYSTQGPGFLPQYDSLDRGDQPDNNSYMRPGEVAQLDHNIAQAPNQFAQLGLPQSSSLREQISKPLQGVAPQVQHGVPLDVINGMMKPQEFMSGGVKLGQGNAPPVLPSYPSSSTHTGAMAGGPVHALPVMPTYPEQGPPSSAVQSQVGPVQNGNMTSYPKDYRPGLNYQGTPAQSIVDFMKKTWQNMNDPSMPRPPGQPNR